MVPGIRLITSGSDRTGSIELFHKIHQLLRQQRVDTFFPFSGQHIRRMSEIQDQISLFQTQRIRFGITPLFQDFITDTPHKNRRMITVTQNKIIQITFMPFIEVTGIIMRRLFLPPHIKSLIHHDKSHTVTKIKQFGCRRIMGTTYAVTPHFFQNLQLPFNGTCIDCRSQTAQIMMHTHTVNFCLPAIQYESFPGIKTKCANANRSSIPIDTFLVSHHFGNQCIQIRCIDIPQLRLLYSQLLGKNTLLTGFRFPGRPGFSNFSAFNILQG